MIKSIFESMKTLRVSGPVEKVSWVCGSWARHVLIFTATALALIILPIDGNAQEPYVKIDSGPGSITIVQIDLFNLVVSTSSTTFVVKASDSAVIYDVWVEVPPENLDSDRKVYRAKCVEFALPLSVTLTGNTGTNIVSVNPAFTNARPVSGYKVDGDNVSGSNSTTGTTYTITLTETTDLLHLYPNIPDCNYSVPFTAHVVLEN